MLSKKKTNTLGKNIDESSAEQSISVTSTDLVNESLEHTTVFPEEDLQIVFIPKSQHEDFNCVIGKHVFIDKPWTKIARKKIIKDLQNTSSCFSKFKKKLEGIEDENVLVGYKPFSDTDEEFLICTTDKARQYIEKSQKQIDHEIKKKEELSMFRMPGPWESKSSEKDIEDIKPVQTREKITYKWKLPAGRLQGKAVFEDSSLKSLKNEHVKLEPRSKEVFEIGDVLTMDSSVQAVRKTVNREMQTIPRIKDNKCIQSVVVEEEMFQLQPLAYSEKALDDFLEKHVPNLVNQLHYNELYDLYRDDYKLLKNENEKPSEQNSKNIKLLPGYQNVVAPDKYVSCHTWHPTIPGIFAVSYMSNSHCLYKSVSLKPSDDEMTKSSIKDEKYGIFYSDDEYNQVLLNNQPEVKPMDENYKEKIMSWLNKEFVQRMRIIQINEDEKNNEQYEQDTMNQLRNSFNYVFREQSDLKNDSSVINADGGNLLNENTITNETLRELVSVNSRIDVDDEWSKLNLENDVSTEEIKFGIRNKDIKEPKTSMKFESTVGLNNSDNKDSVDHHDSDTESFYNIWGEDEDWLYGNKLRDTVRKIHREFNQKYDREAREEKLLKLLKSEVKYTKRKNKIKEMKKERLKLVKDMFEAGDVYSKLKTDVENKSKKRRKSSSKQKKQHKAPPNYEESMAKRENTSIIDEQNNNSVIIWSINDNIFPKLRLESPEEVCCVEFNPVNGETVVGGLTNGQICIWDIKGKLEAINTNDSGMSEREKKHHRNLWMHMKWSLDVKFKTRIRPAALSAILESHDSIVTAIQWIHPMNEITPQGKLVTVQEGQFSLQFFSASMDGTIKLWDLNSTPLPKSKQRKTANTRFEYPEELNKYKSPLSIYNNRLKPSYTIIVLEPDSTTHSPITAFSFEIPLMQYKCTSNQPIEIGKRQFAYVPTTPNDPNRILVVGSISGQIGVITWNGYDTHQQCNEKEECKYIWWGHVHDGPINSIKRNVFYPDIHLVCGGHIVSIWSLNYKNGPIWWKRFDDFTNSVLWSTIHPAEFRVSFNANGILQFWNLMKYTHQPYYTSDISLSDGFIATLSAPHPSIHFIGSERFQFAKGVNEVMNYEKNELISFSDFAGAIMMVTIDAAVMEPNEIDKIASVFQKEVDWRRELDAWNDQYKELYGSIEKKNEDNYKAIEKEVSTMIPIEEVQLNSTPGHTKRKICDETFKWYFNRRGSHTRLGKMKEKYMEREKRYMVEAMMKKKNISEKQLEEYYKETKEKKYEDNYLTKIQFEADETYKDIVNKLLAAEHNEEYVDVNTNRNTKSEDIKYTFEKIHKLLEFDTVAEKEKLADYVKNNPYKTEHADWAQIIENAERDVRDTLNDSTLLKGPALRMMRRKLAKKYIDQGFKIKEWKTRKDEHECDRYRMRESKIEKLKSMYGNSYDPYWDQNLPPQKMKDAIQLRVTDKADYEQSFERYFEEGDGCYTGYLTLMESDSDYPASRSPRESSISHDKCKTATPNSSQILDSGVNRWEEIESVEQGRPKTKDPYEIQRTDSEHIYSDTEEQH